MPGGNAAGLESFIFGKTASMGASDAKLIAIAALICIGVCALLFKELATLRRDVPLEESLGDLEWRGVPRRKFSAFCDEFGFAQLRDRPHLWDEQD